MKYNSNTKAFSMSATTSQFSTSTDGKGNENGCFFESTVKAVANRSNQQKLKSLIAAWAGENVSSDGTKLELVQRLSIAIAALEIR
jgi:ATP-dependent helicase/DNAse subunit B